MLIRCKLFKCLLMNKDLPLKKHGHHRELNPISITESTTTGNFCFFMVKILWKYISIYCYIFVLCCYGQNIATVMVFYWFNKDPESQSNTMFVVLCLNHQVVRPILHFTKKIYVKLVLQMLSWIFWTMFWVLQVFHIFVDRTHQLQVLIVFFKHVFRNIG